MAITICKACGNKFSVKPSRIKAGNGKYCSTNCQYISYRKGQFVHCKICGKKLWRKPLQIRRSKSQQFFCSKSHQTLWRNRLFSGEAHPNWKNGENVGYRKILINNGIKQFCKLCNSKDFRVLVVHHLDKDRKNNTIKNLIWLCYNCHFLVHNYNVKVK